MHSQLKKVCHVTTVHTRYDTRIFHKECTSLARAGYDVTLLVADNVPDEIKNGVKITSIKIQARSRLQRILMSPKAALQKAIQINADIYHLHDPELLTIALRLKKLNKKVIFDSHEDVGGSIKAKEWIPKFLRPIVSSVYIKYTNTVTKQLDSVISVTPHIVENLKLINPKTIMLTNYPILTEQDKSIEKKQRTNAFVFAGGITNQWNHITILGALGKVDARYLLMGTVAPAFLVQLTKHEAWEKVDFLGKLPQEQVKTKLSSCVGGLAVVDYSDNMGGTLGTLGNTKLFEYMQAGIPVICTDFILWNGIIRKWNCGICVPPRDVASLAQAMQFLVDNPDIASKMGANGRLAVEKEYNWEMEEKKLLECYLTL